MLEVAVIAILLVGLIVFIGIDIRKGTAFTSNCVKRGGVVVSLQGASLCLRSFQVMEEP